MSMLKRIIFASFLAVATFSIATAQESVNSVAQRSSVTITAAAFGDRIRITAPASVVGMHVEVFAASGEKVLDQEIKSGNVFDWQLPSGQRLPAGRYVCLVTTKSISGRLTQRLGAVKVDDLALSVEPGDSAQLSSPQAQAIGPVEENSSWTVLGSDEIQTPTVIGHDGTDGQLTRGRGALTFRFGDFFSGKDKEQMRLTEEGNLGIGTDNPQATLDVAGTIRAEKGIEFADGTVQTTGLSGRKDKDGTLQPNVSGTGTTGRLTKWTNGPTGTLGDSVVTESGGNLGVGVTNPAQKLHVVRSFSGTNPLTPDRIGAFVNDGAPANHAILAVIAGSNGVAGIDLGDTQNQNQSYVRYNNGTLGERLRFGINNADVLILQSNGNVGIGTETPTARLHVAGNGLVTGNLTVNGALSADGSGLTNLNAGNITAGTLDNARLGVVPTDKGGTGLSAAGAAGNFLRSNGTGWTSAALLSSDIPEGSTSYIQSNPASQQAGSFNISGNGTAGGTLSANIVSATTQYNFGVERVLAISGTVINPNSNTFVGVGSGAANPTGVSNSFFGRNAGAANTTGNANSFFGFSAGAANTAGGNSFFGSLAGATTTIGFANSFFGFNAGAANTTGQSNSFFGNHAGWQNTTGDFNSFFGLTAGSLNTTGGDNSFFGRSAGGANTDGGDNSFFGTFAGDFNTTGNDNTIIGHNADVGSNNLTFATALGAEAVVNANDTIVLGKVAGTYSGAARPADTVRVPGKILAEADAGGTAAVGVGEYYRDNAIVAWAAISATGSIGNNFGVSSVEHTTTGIYTITLDASALGGSSLIPVAIAEIDSAPTSAATLRIVSINQVSANSFQVFINNGTGALVDNDFVFIATAR